MAEGAPEPAIAERLRAAPDVPGVYLMRGAGGEVLYVGKAASLRARLRSYVDPARQGPKTVLLVRQAAGVEWFETDTEVEALILEDSLIKRHRPRYNIRLRDDKTYPFLRLSVPEPFPALTVVRRPAQDGARYFGPYIPASALRATLRLLRQLFPLRLCRTLRPGRPCLNHQMGRCLAPCAGRVDAARYGELVRGVTLFLQGRGAELAGELRREMALAAGELRYEEAAELRDRIRAIEATLERQRVHDPEGGDFDVAGVVRLGERVGVSLLHVRAGRLIGTEAFSLRDPLAGEGGGEALARVLRDCYAGVREIPPEVVVAEAPAGAEAIRDWLARARGAAVRLTALRAGSRRALLAMAGRNALRLLQEEKAGAAGGDALLEEVGRVAGAGGELRSLACLDVSNLSGTDAVASLVWWEGGALCRQRYRRFRIRRGGAPDDFAMLGEAVGRLAARVSSGSWTGPDVVLLDGGRGQLSAGEGALLASAWRPRLLLSIAKPSEKRGTDAIFAAGRPAPLALAAGNPALALLQRVRDEAHRFAVAYHRSLRSQRLLTGPLSGIPGLGPARRARLLESCGGVAGVRAASRAEIERVLPARVAAAVHAVLHPEEPGAGGQTGGAPGA
ncbi:MAG TPA: excinuclease ABC subunit UvrC [Candidatus Methanoperedens sp.]|nr:excinuclease ABC subunit UvrC [Candidatus Methanoperedens sp.]